MEDALIKISPVWYDDESDFYEYRLAIAGAVCKPSVQFYGNPDCFHELGEGLANFPANIEDVVLFDADGYKDFIKLKIYCYDRSGNTAIHVLAEIQDEYIIAGYKCDFHIPTSAASLNILGQLLRSWDPSMGKELIWPQDI